MDPWIAQPSLSLDLKVGLPTPAKVVLVEETNNFLAVSRTKDREVCVVGARSSIARSLAGLRTYDTAAMTLC
jgi:hypothetical protein